MIIEKQPDGSNPTIEVKTKTLEDRFVDLLSDLGVMFVE
jgi:hypothetical protein